MKEEAGGIKCRTYQAYSDCSSRGKSHARTYPGSPSAFFPRLSSSRIRECNNEEFSFAAIGYWLRPHVVENGGVGREGLASANQSHRSHFFQWRRTARDFH